jgi:hypothetical protein
MRRVSPEFSIQMTKAACRQAWQESRLAGTAVF